MPAAGDPPVTASPLKIDVPAEKLPLASLATIAFTVFALAAVVAEFETLPDVEIVANFVSAIAAVPLTSASAIVPSVISAELTLFSVAKPPRPRFVLAVG